MTKVTDDSFDLPALTPSQEVLLEAYADGATLSEAAALAYPESSRAMELASALIESNEFVKARFHLYLDECGVKDQDIAKNLARATALAEANPKASGALLNATKFAAEIKNLLPAKVSNKDFSVNGTQILTQQQTIINYMESAKEHLSDEKIDALIEDDAIIVVDTIPKDVLFDD